MFSLNLSGVKELQDAFTQAAAEMTEQAKQAVTNTANAIADDAKQNCRGKLAESITTDIADDGLSAVISSNDPNAVYVEYGASIPAIHAEKAKVLHWVEDGKDVFVRSAQGHENAPRPFLNPAAEANMETLLNNLSI